MTHSTRIAVFGAVAAIGVALFCAVQSRYLVVAHDARVHADRLALTHHANALVTLVQFAGSGDRSDYTAFQTALAAFDAHAWTRPLTEVDRRSHQTLTALDGNRTMGRLISSAKAEVSAPSEPGDDIAGFRAAAQPMSMAASRLRDIGSVLVAHIDADPADIGAVMRASLPDFLDAFKQIGDADLRDDGARTWVRWLIAAISAMFVAVLFIALGAFAFALRRQRTSLSEFPSTEERLNLVLSGSNDGAWDWDIARDEVYYSPRFKQMLGIPDAEPGYQQRQFMRHLHADDRAVVRRAYNAHVREGVAFDVDFRMRTRAGDFDWFHARGKVVKDSRGQSVRMAGSVTGISDRKNLESELEFHATHDPLTGVFNRRKFKEVLAYRLRAPEWASVRMTLLFLDLDQFKIVNDTCGHAAGDQLLCEVSRLLGRELEDSECIARLGGDEFAILLSNRPIESAWAFAEGLREAIHEFKFVHGKRAFWLSVSIGLVALEPGLDTIDAALTNADRACFLAKEEGRNRIRLYAHSDRDIITRREEMDWASRLRTALAEDRLELYAQPIIAVDATRKTTAHREILLRLIDENGKVVPPMAFIPAAERYGLMPEIDRWVIDAAFTLYAASHRVPDRPVDEIWAINLSGTTLADDDFPSFLQRQFMAHDVPFGAICFEVTETAVVSDLGRVGKFMRVMKSLGCRFALDDFGAGASSFSYLKRLPVDYLKIDASLVREMLTDAVDDAMVEAINRIGHVMNIETIAEGVESIELVARLEAMGVDYAQGFALGMPMPFRPGVEMTPHAMR